MSSRAPRIQVCRWDILSVNPRELFDCYRPHIAAKFALSCMKEFAVDVLGWVFWAGRPVQQNSLHIHGSGSKTMNFDGGHALYLEQSWNARALPRSVGIKQHKFHQRLARWRYICDNRYPLGIPHQEIRTTEIRMLTFGCCGIGATLPIVVLLWL